METMTVCDSDHRYSLDSVTRVLCGMQTAALIPAKLCLLNEGLLNMGGVKRALTTCLFGPTALGKAGTDAYANMPRVMFLASNICCVNSGTCAGA